MIDRVESTAETMRPARAPRMKGMVVTSGTSRKSGRESRSSRPCPPSITGSAFGRRARYHQETMRRTSVVAVHICTMVPIATVTAKPFTVPLPKM